MARWRLGYDEAGIAENDVPPAALTSEVRRAGLVAASDMRRALESAMRLAPGRDLAVTPLLREMPQPAPRWLKLRLPPKAWRLVIDAYWGASILARRDARPEDLTRARAAAEWLTRMADEHGVVATLTHGVFRRLLDRELKALGWHAEQRRRGYRHWSVWPFVKNPGAI